MRKTIVLIAISTMIGTAPLQAAYGNTLADSPSYDSQSNGENSTMEIRKWLRQQGQRIRNVGRNIVPVGRRELTEEERYFRAACQRLEEIDAENRRITRNGGEPYKYIIAGGSREDCYPQPAQPAATVTPDRVATAFRALNIPKPVIKTEPGADPILQIPVNLIAQATPLSRTTSLLGTRLRIRATPVSYRWTVTDLTTGKISGEPIETTNPGQPYAVANDLQVSHTFHYPGPYRITLATTYHGEYTLGTSNTWTPIPGTVTTTATPTTLTAIEYRNYLINDPDEK